MRSPIIVGNWKMNYTVENSRLFISELSSKMSNDVIEVKKVVCPPYTALLAVSAMIMGTSIELGAQNIHWEAKGAFTGEISPDMAAEFCKYVIVGHSERRAYFGETDEIVHKKVLAAIKANLTPIVCVGETLEQYESGQTENVILRQVRTCVRDTQIDQASEIIIAYEPVWAIGTGRASSPENAQNVMKRFIREPLVDIFGEGLANEMRILYGGSVNAENAERFFKQPDIDGALVGGASLKVDEFIAIIKAASKNVN